LPVLRRDAVADRDCARSTLGGRARGGGARVRRRCLPRRVRPLPAAGRGGFRLRVPCPRDSRAEHLERDLMGQILERAEQCWSGGVEPREFWKATGVTEEIASGVYFVHAFANVTVVRAGR